MRENYGKLGKELRDKRLKFGHDGVDCVIITSLAPRCFEAFLRRKILVSVFFLLMKINCSGGGVCGVERGSIIFNFTVFICMNIFPL